MYQVRADKKKNRLYLTFGTIEDEAEMLEIIETIRSESKKLKKGFTCLTDLRRYDPEKGIFDKHIKTTQESLVKAGMAKVVRVRSPMGSMAHFQFNNLSYVSHEKGYYAPNVTTVEEGERLLDETDE